MKVFLITCTLAAAMTAIAAMAGAHADVRPFNTTLKADAIEVLAANGIWAPNLSAFAAGDFNFNGVNFTAEEEKFNKSDLDINDLIQVRIDSSALEATTTADDVGGSGSVEKGSCDKCSLCTKACAAWTILWIL